MKMLIHAAALSLLLALAQIGVAAGGEIEDAASAYRNGDYAAALLQFRSLADQGKPVAQYDLAQMYFDGRGVPRDPLQAAKWFRRAADQGHAGAQNSLGALYLSGQGVEQNTAEAIRFYRLSAAQGYAIAQHNLGSIYISGRYLPQNFEEGAKWLQLAADQGIAGSMLGLGALYEDGQGAPQDYVKAHVWYNLAATHFPSTESELRGEAAKLRDELALKMSSAQIAEALRLAKEWTPKK